MKQKILAQGAEAKIILKDNIIIKKRIKKSYRILEIDQKINKLRTRGETKLLIKASQQIPIPKVLKSDEKTKQITMEFINGKKLSDYLNNFSLEKQKQTCKQIGQNIAKLHDSNIIHGDLTTSNMILKNKEVFFIDFGLGFISHKIEDKAVDLHLLNQALEARHPQNWEILFKEIKKKYQKSKNSKKVFNQLKKVEKRGRYKHF
jgi:TP53 regulating kinase-like protein